MKRLLSLVALVPLCLSTLAATTLRSPGDDGNDPEFDEVKARVYASILSDDEKGFKRLDKPKPGEWLSFYKEIPQTLERYRFAARVRSDDHRKVIVLQPLGEMNEEQLQLIDTLREYTSTFFHLPVRVEKPLGFDLPGQDKSDLTRMLPAGQRHGVYDRQYNADKILTDILQKRLPDDAIVYLGITLVDLYAGNSAFVFGVGSLDHRVGVYSLCRYYPEFWGIERQPQDNLTALRRACKVLNHETGHMFGLTHCVFYRCSMNGSNSLTETDAAPIHYCPLCERKLLWNIGYEPLQRYSALEKFYREHKLTNEADWMLKRIDNFKKVQQAETAQKMKDD